MADLSDILADPVLEAPEKAAPSLVDDASQAEAARSKAAVVGARGVTHKTPRDLAPTPKTPEEYASVIPGTQWVDPEGNYRTKPYEPKSPADYRKVPEGQDWVDPEGNLHTKPVYEDLGYTAQVLFNMSTNDRERKKALEHSYPGRVKQEEGTGDFYVEEEDGTLRKPRNFLRSPLANLTASAAPTLGAVGGEIAGGAIGTVLGPLGTAGGAIAGGGIGSSAGQGFNDLFLKALDIYDRSAEDETAELLAAGGFGAAGSGLGRLLGAKAAGAKSLTKLSPPGMLSSVLGVDKEGLDLALQLKSKGVENIPPSLYAKESPHLVNLVEVFDRTFNQAQPLLQSAEKHFETQGKEILGKLGADTSKIDSLAHPTAAVPTADAGTKILEKARMRVQEVNDRLAALVTQQTNAKTGKPIRLQELQGVERDARRAATDFLNANYQQIEREIEQGFRIAESGRNTGDLWQRVGDRFVALKRAANAEANRQYGQWDQQFGAIPAPQSVGLAEEAENFLGLLPQEFRNNNPALVRNLARLGGIRNEAGELIEPPAELNLQQLHELRTLFRANINWRTLPSDIVNGAKKLFEGRINDILQRSEGGQDLARIDRWYRDTFEIFNERRLQAVINGLEGGEPADPHVLYDALVKTGRSDLNRRIEQMVGPNLWAGIRAADADALMQSARTENPGQIDAGAFIRGVMERHRSGMLQSIHGERVAQQWLDQVRNLKLLDGRLDLATAPGDRIPDVIARVRNAVDAIRAEKEADPLKLLGQEMQKIKLDKRAFQNEELGFLYNPNMGAEEAVDKLLSSPQHIYAAERMFGRDSDEFKMMQQIYAQRVLQGELEPGKRLAEISPEIQRLMFPGITYDDMQMLAKEMKGLMGTRALQDQARSMAAQAKVEHPMGTFSERSVLGSAIKGTLGSIPGADFVMRGALGKYYGFMRWLTSHQYFLEFLKKGVRSNDPAVKKQTRDAMRAALHRYTQISGPTGAAISESQYQAGRQDNNDEAAPEPVEAQ